MAQTCWVSPDWVQDRDQANPSEWIRQLAVAGFDAVWAWCKWHDGLCFWPTESSSHTNRDFVGETCEAARSHNMRVIAYYSVGEDDIAAREHPDWKAVDRSGEPCYQGFGFDYNCINSPYRRLVLDQVHEIISSYGPDGLWLDHLYFPPHGCYCEFCKRSFWDQTGIQLEQATDDERLAFQGEILRSLLAEIKTHAREENSEALVSYNGAGSWAHPSFQDLEDLADFNVREGHSTSVISWGGHLLAGNDKPYEIMLSGCIPERWVLWALKPQPALRTEAALVAAHGGVVNVAFNPTPSGSMRDAEWANLRELGSWLKSRDQFHDLEYVADVAVLRPPEAIRSVGPYNADGQPRVPMTHSLDWDSSGFLLREGPQRHNAPGNASRHAVGHGFDGIIQALDEACIPSRVLTSWDTATLQRYRVVVVTTELSASETACAAHYVASGGTLLVVGRDYAIIADNPDLARLLGLRPAGNGPRTASYLDLPASLQGPIMDYPMLITGRSVLCELETAEAMATFRAPEEEWSWYKQAGSDWHAPSGQSAGVALACQRVGRGQAWWIGAPIGDHIEDWGSNDPWTKAWLGYLIRSLGGGSMFEISDPPGYLRVVARSKDGKLVLHMINLLPTAHESYSSEIGESCEVQVALPKRGSIPRVRCEPEGIDLAVEEHTGQWHVQVPPFGIHIALVIENDGDG